MKRLTFWKDKLHLMWAFAWMREWKLLREEWRMTYQEMQEAEANFEETNREAVARLLEEIRRVEEAKHQALEQLFAPDKVQPNAVMQALADEYQRKNTRA